MEHLAKSSDRYLFSSQSFEYLESGKANLSISNTCLKYLRSNCFDATISDDRMLAGIERGAYVLLDYVASYWLDHIVQTCSHDMASQDFAKLTQDIEGMIGTRRNSKFVPVRACRSSVLALDVFTNRSKIVYETLLETCSSDQRKRIEYSLSDGEITAV